MALAVKDWIIALFADAQHAAKVRVELVDIGIAVDRLDVIAWQDIGRAAVVPGSNDEEQVRKHLAMLFEGRADAARAVESLIGSLKSGNAFVVVQPRGVVEIRESRAVLDANLPKEQFLNLTPMEKQGGLLGERAAGGS